MTARKKVIMICAAAVMLLATLFRFYGYQETWELWNIPTMSPHFADLRAITHGAESYARGLDPMVENPADPWQRTLNYPRIWQSLYWLGINHKQTTGLGIIIILCFLVGICLMLPNACNKTIAMVFAAVLSPATLLGVERGNIDLLVFFFVCLSVATLQRSYLLSTFVMTIGVLLKLFPVFGYAFLFKAEKPRFTAYMFLVLAIVSLYVYVTMPDLVLISEGTPKGTSLSYGMDVLWMHLSSLNTTLGLYTKISTYIYTFLAIFISFFVLINGKDQITTDSQNHYIDLFRVGSAIYIGTFIIGNNYDYRLMFLILTIPQLFSWSVRSSGIVKKISTLVIISTYLSLWHLLIAYFLEHLPYGDYISFVSDEIFNWMTFSGLLYLFFSSLPVWASELARRIYPLTCRSR